MWEERGSAYRWWPQGPSDGLTLVASIQADLAREAVLDQAVLDQEDRVGGDPVVDEALREGCPEGD